MDLPINLYLPDLEGMVLVIDGVFDFYPLAGGLPVVVKDVHTEQFAFTVRAKGFIFLDAEQITKNKLYIYTREKNTGFDRRILMKRVGEGWKIDAVQERLNGWQRTEV